MHVVKTTAKHIPRHYYINTTSPSIAGFPFFTITDTTGETNNKNMHRWRNEKPAVTATARSTRGGAVVVYHQPASKRRTFRSRHHRAGWFLMYVVSVTPRFPDAEFPGGNNLLKGSVYRWPKGSGLGPGSARQALKVNS
jgi:hypothetical protein